MNLVAGNLYLWGDFDQPLPGMPEGTHLRILRISGFENMKPPPYDEALKKPTNPPYPASAPYSTGSTYPNLEFAQGGGDAASQAPYPAQGAAFPPQSAPYPQESGQFYPQGQPNAPQGLPHSGNVFGGGPPQQSYGQGQHAYYPPQEEKNCSIQ